MKLLFAITVAIALVAAASASTVRQGPDYEAVSGTSGNSAGLRRFIERYTKLLGGEDNMNQFGPLPDGHRTIDWDAPGLPGVPDLMPPNAFNAPPAPRGIEFSSKGDEFLVSNPGNVANSPVDNRFSSINRLFPNIFTTFSPNRLFAAPRSNVITAHFFVAGSKIRAATTGFGAVFTDVDLRDKTCIEYFARNGRRLAKICAKPKNRGLSFIGVVFKEPIVARVKITAGTIPLIENPNKGDHVVIDDLLFGEPQAL